MRDPKDELLTLQIPWQKMNGYPFDEVHANLSPGGGVPLDYL